MCITNFGNNLRYQCLFSLQKCKILLILLKYRKVVKE